MRRTRRKSRRKSTAMKFEHAASAAILIVGAFLAIKKAQNQPSTINRLTAAEATIQALSVV